MKDSTQNIMKLFNYFRFGLLTLLISYVIWIFTILTLQSQILDLMDKVRYSYESIKHLDLNEQKEITAQWSIWNKQRKEKEALLNKLEFKFQGN